MATPTPTMQYLLELTNRARIDPYGEYARLVTNAPKNVADAISYFKVNLTVLKQQFDALTPSAPLAWNEKLAAAATGHSQMMINQDTQSHQLAGEPNLGTRITNAGYSYSSAGENIYAYSEDAFYAHAGFFIDWGFSSTGIQDGAGHRVNIMSARFSEVGFGYLYDNNPATEVGTDVVTQNFGNRRDYKAQLTGVVINDKDGDRFYDVGEGIGGVNIKAVGTAGTFSTTTWDAGGYNLVVPAGTYQVTFSQGSKSWTTTATMNSDNVKVDALIANMTTMVDNGTRDGLYDISRFYNTKTGAHFYTASDAERDAVIAANGPFLYEGNSFDSNATASNGVAIYRFYNNQTGVHFYTASEDERKVVASTMPQFKEEGLAYYAYAGGGDGKMALHRFFNTQTGTHFYTTSETEKQNISVTLPQFKYEGIGYYVDIA